MKIAVIGSGISGLGAALLLSAQHEVTVFERNDYVGGHSRTIEVGESKQPVDTGFIVFNERNYPHLTGMFKYLNVPVQKSDMSFGASIANGWLEYSSKGLLGQKRNWLRPAYWRMLLDILRFNRQATRYIDAPPHVTLGQVIADLRLGVWFRDYYLLAMGAAIWSCSVQTMLAYPASSFLRFFKNHGLLTVNDQPQWYTVTGGSRTYVQLLRARLSGHIRTQTPISKIVRQAQGVELTDAAGQTYQFDQVVIAAHANEALAMLDSPTSSEREILGSFQFQPNDVVVHNDRSFMPRIRACWASWIYLTEGQRDERSVVSLTYWMNLLQGIPDKLPIYITLNPGRAPAAGRVYDHHVFSHPVFTTATLTAQQRLAEIQGVDRIWYAGAWQRYGFHEDGLLSAVNVAAKMGITPPWT